MQIISLNFWVFTLVVILVYYLLPRRAQNYWLLVCSYVFYATWKLSFVGVLLAATLWNYFVAQMLVKRLSNRKLWLWIGIGLNLLSLAFFRFEDSGYAVRLLKLLFEGKIVLDILLPVGFAFYILGAISYLLDVYRGMMPPEKDFVDFALYMAYFPKMISGPIERARLFLPRLAAQRRVDNQTIAQSFALLVVGLARKLLVAEMLFKYIPQNMFYEPGKYTAPELLWGLLLYSFWLYNDFAGYTSIVRSISGFLGIELSANFQQPYFSKSFTEFWNRWHISLSHWLRDYIYYPLSRVLRRKFNSHHLVNVVVPPMLTMLASGLWHNFGVYMLFWGALHGLYQAGERLVLMRKTGGAQKQPAWQRMFSMAGVFILVAFAWVAFGSGSFSRFLVFWKTMFLSVLLIPQQISAGTIMSSPALTLVEPLIILALSILLDFGQYHYDDEIFFMRWPQLAQAGLLAFTILLFLMNGLLGDVTSAPFVYQGF